MASPCDIVTGAYGFTGRYLTRRLLAQGRRVITLTDHPRRPHAFREEVPAREFHFDAPDRLAGIMEGAETFYNTYWIRFEYGPVTYAVALERTRILVTAAARAGVRRLVHFSSAGADPDSDLAYFRAKAEAEKVARDSGLPVTVIRPTLLFGAQSALFNNLAWMLRRLPLFALCGEGRAPVQPVHVDDVARVAIAAAAAADDGVQGVGGPETLDFADLIQTLRRAAGGRARIVRVKMERLMHKTRLLERMVDDVVVTREELTALNRGLLVVPGPPAGTTPIGPWLQEHGEELGRRYLSSLDRYYRQAED